LNAASVGIASLDERKNAVYPRSIALVHRDRHAQGDGGEERVGRRDEGGRRPGVGTRFRGRRLGRGPVRSGRPWRLQRRSPEQELVR
jgi:hypothetical protein